MIEDTKAGKATFEVAGREFEVPMDEFRLAVTFRVGDRVKLLKKGYGDDYKVYPGCIVGVDRFEKLPTIVIAYCEASYSTAPEVKFAYLNRLSKDIEIAPMVEDEQFPVKEEILQQFDAAKGKLEEQLRDLAMKREYFLRKFGVSFGQDAHSTAIGTGPDGRPEEISG